MKSIKPNAVRYVWLTELHRQWDKARGKKIGTHSRSFFRNWAELLNDSDLHSAEDRNYARLEADELEVEKHIKLHRMPARPYIILKIELPLDKESWLKGIFHPDLAA